ncbi:MAG: hypothetical protein HY231_26760 [Acidobacteria bacterium]|nr:hypothetical protein [Acidobacteriota bacterium]
MKHPKKTIPSKGMWRSFLLQACLTVNHKVDISIYGVPLLRGSFPVFNSLNLAL